MAKGVDSDGVSGAGQVVGAAVGAVGVHNDFLASCLDLQQLLPEFPYQGRAGIEAGQIHHQNIDLAIVPHRIQQRQQIQPGHALVVK